VHHLVFLPDLSSALELKKKFEGYGNMDSWGCGRPKLKLSAEKVAEKVSSCGGLIGPAHAFTPYFSLYAHFNSPQELYGAQSDQIKFLELGLSADTDLADLIETNHQLVFLSNSDSHSPWPHRLGREFNRIDMKKPSFNELKKALENKAERKFALNVGFDPREGKYHCTACNSCYAQYSLEQAQAFHWKCPDCQGSIKKGVRDRILELSSFDEETHPAFRPDYVHILPLAEIIAQAFKINSVNSKKVQSNWRDLVDAFQSEIDILIDEPIEKLAQQNELISEKINSFRQGFVLFMPGGGGQYGQPIICDSKKEFEAKKVELGKKLECPTGASGQKTLNQFQ
jgi:uncharacterized protein (TIGR00375 family)